MQWYSYLLLGFLLEGLASLGLAQGVSGKYGVQHGQIGIEFSEGSNIDPAGPQSRVENQQSVRQRRIERVLRRSGQYIREATGAGAANFNNVLILPFMGDEANYGTSLGHAQALEAAAFRRGDPVVRTFPEGANLWEQFQISDDPISFFQSLSPVEVVNFARQLDLDPEDLEEWSQGSPKKNPYADLNLSRKILSGELAVPGYTPPHIRESTYLDRALFWLLGTDQPEGVAPKEYWMD